MRKDSRKQPDEMKPEYTRADLGPLVRGKYAQRYRESSNVVVIDPDVHKAFPNARAVNTALRRLLQSRKRSAGTRAKRS
jgi:hypothetical protein